MNDTLVRTCLMAVLVVMFGGCGLDVANGPLRDFQADLPDSGGELCPSEKPAEVAACDLPAESQCSYLIESCACGPSDLSWTCECKSGHWQCYRDYDCYPCPDGGGVEHDAPGASDFEPDLPADPCESCQADEICMQGFDGTCTNFGAKCVKVSATCLQEAKTIASGGSCYGVSPACEAEFCWSPLQCSNQAPCGAEAANVDIYCYGP